MGRRHWSRALVVVLCCPSRELKRESTQIDGCALEDPRTTAVFTASALLTFRTRYLFVVGIHSVYYRMWRGILDQKSLCACRYSQL